MVRVDKVAFCHGCSACNNPAAIKQALKEYILPKTGVLGVGLGGETMLNVYVESEEVIKTLPTIFNHGDHRYLLFFKVGRIVAHDAT